jgi:hypothetical protein
MTDEEINRVIGEYTGLINSGCIAFTRCLNQMAKARKSLNSQEQIVKFLNSLRAIVSERCPKNKVGSPLVSDFNLIDASAREQAIAFLKAVNKYVAN